MLPDLKFADELAQEMRSRNQPHTWRNVTSVLTECKRYKLTRSVRAEVQAAFDNAGLVCVPSMMQVDRAARIRLTLKEFRDPNAAGLGLDGPLPTGLTLWERAGGRWQDLSAQPKAGSHVLVDINLSLVVDRARIGSLLTGLGGLNDAILQDLLEPDPHATFKEKSGDVRRASLFVVDSDPDAVDSSDKAIHLSRRLVEFAMGRGWLVIARHPSQAYVSGSPHDSSHAIETADMYIGSLRSCRLDDATSVEGVALAIITQSVDSISRVRAHLNSYLESWRTHSAAGSVDRKVLLDLQATLPLVVEALEPLLHPSVSAWVESTWAKEAATLSNQMRRVLDALHNLQGTTAAAIAQADQAQNEKYQRGLATLAAIFLAPSLVASVFGANQVLTDSPRNLLWLVVSMVIAGVVTQVAISRVFRPRINASSNPPSKSSRDLGNRGWRPHSRSNGTSKNRSEPLAEPPVSVAIPPVSSG